MSLKKLYTSREIRKVSESLKQEMPAYKQILDFYGELFAAQEEFRTGHNPEPLNMENDLLQLKLHEKMPLIDLAGYTPDIEKTGKVLARILKLAQNGNEILAEAGNNLSEALDLGRVTLEEMAGSVFQTPADTFVKAAHAAGITPEHLYFFIYNSIKPHLAAEAEQAAALLPGDTSGGGYCPVCGSKPALSVFGDNGDRYFCCSVCTHEWKAHRIYCPYCDNRDGKTLKYLYDESDKRFRADLCDSCRQYIKTVDTRETERPFLSSLELVITLHLDIKAGEAGYQSGARMIFDQKE